MFVVGAAAIAGPGVAALTGPGAAAATANLASGGLNTVFQGAQAAGQAAYDAAASAGPASGGGMPNGPGVPVDTSGYLAENEGWSETCGYDRGGVLFYCDEQGVHLRLFVDAPGSPSGGAAAGAGSAAAQPRLWTRFVNWVKSLVGRGPQAESAGSTASLAKGTTLARSLRESLAIKQAMANPTAGQQVRIVLKDGRWPASQGWVKMQQIVKSGGREGPINVHYVYNTVTGAADDFKIVMSGAR
ncbi:MAG: hypothetical protein JW940_12995 [Polyangiaceae bacterium]|nr:hypothetical protein [Polyangiaceae bacterium]